MGWGNIYRRRAKVFTLALIIYIDYKALQKREKFIKKSKSELFLDFDENPLATASIAQVHRATLIDGQKVVVKVQHEDIKKIILEDLKDAKSIVDWIAWAEPQYNFSPMIDEWCKEAPKELDFNHEAENTRTVSKNLGCTNKYDSNKPINQVDVLIPEVIQSTEKVLILEYMDGIRLNDFESLEACGANKQKIVEEITRAFAHQIYVDGFFNGDPHPGNFLVSKEPPHRPILLDFGLTKRISSSMKQSLAKMFLATAEGDHAMDFISVFFRTSTSASEAAEYAKSLGEQRARNMKIDAFPGDMVIFSRVIGLLRGLSTTLDARIVYHDIMRPFAESVLQEKIAKGPSENAQWINDTPVHSDVEAKLRQILVELGNDDKILGIQVCAYKDEEVIIDTAAGVLGRYDPRPVQPDSLFPVFSVTKGITAGMLHWLVDKGKLNLNENIADIWPEFGTNGKNLIKVHHVLNHTSGLQNALANLREENPLLMADWDECLKRIAMSAPETEPGQEQLYHYLSFGWLCGGIIEHASGKKFQEILEEAIVRPLNIGGELYVGIPPGVESRLASLTVDKEDFSKLSKIASRPELPSTFQPENISQLVTVVPALFNMLNVRRAIIPSANGHCSARALARYYAALVDGGLVPPPHSSLSKPPLGTHPHIPKFPSEITSKKQKGKKSKAVGSASKKKGNGYELKMNHSKDFKDGDNGRESNGDGYTRLANDNTGGSSSVASPPKGFAASENSRQNNAIEIFNNPRIHDEFMGVDEYRNLVLPNGKFGLGFRRFSSSDGSFYGFGHSGLGGSTGFCDIKNRFAIAVTLNKMSFGTATRRIIQFVCSELNVPLPDEFSVLSETVPDEESSILRPMIN
ncbi:ABC1 FAMILY PROTEIN [Salix koriyanagi]|uniref:ABC1 FAMILY PROTEIN n=1 Tax=Salix koriyanagi TaxID=2511006 RepID=A0A9Q1A5K6_9ROSI|nr:ABC1 FAMILY PROTEIN [Salix koriyanagi]